MQENRLALPMMVIEPMQVNGLKKLQQKLQRKKVLILPISTMR